MSVKVGDLVEPVSAFRRARRGTGVVVRIEKEKFEPSKAEVVFPSSTLETDKKYRKNTLWFFLSDLRVISEGGGSGKAQT